MTALTLILLTLTALAGSARSGSSPTPLITTLNGQVERIRNVRAAKCLTPPRFRWHPGHMVPEHMRLFVIGQRRARLAANRDRSSMCGPEAAIRRVFGAYASQALSVAWCESRFDVYARNGQYLGLFQMGDYARSTYGHSWTALGQSRSAYAYFVEAGADWSPWECKP